MVIILAALMLGCAGDTTDTTDNNNVYQPAGVVGVDCPEIEYRWTNDTGLHQAFYDGSGGFCTSIAVDWSLDRSLEARCVARNSSGEIWRASAWVDGTKSTDMAKFRKLCPR